MLSGVSENNQRISGGFRLVSWPFRGVLKVTWGNPSSSLLESKGGFEAFQSASGGLRMPGPSDRWKPPNPWWNSVCTELFREKSEFWKRGLVERYVSIDRKLWNFV